MPDEAPEMLPALHALARIIAAQTDRECRVIQEAICLQKTSNERVRAHLVDLLYVQAEGRAEIAQLLATISDRVGAVPYAPEIAQIEPQAAKPAIPLNNPHGITYAAPAASEREFFDAED